MEIQKMKLFKSEIAQFFPKKSQFFLVFSSPPFPCEEFLVREFLVSSFLTRIPKYSYEAWFEHKKKLVEKIIWISTKKYITYICLWSFAIMKGFEISSDDRIAILLNKIRHMISDDAFDDLSVDWKTRPMSHL